MLGWHITLYQAKDGMPDRTLATWQTGADGLSWLDPLIRQGQAEVLQNDGYPDRYRVLAKAALPDPQKAQCDPDEWLILEAWDES